jgi:hypothetical protein
MKHCRDPMSFSFVLDGGPTFPAQNAATVFSIQTKNAMTETLHLETAAAAAAALSHRRPTSGNVI